MAIRTRLQSYTTLSTTSKEVFTVPGGAVKVIIQNKDASITVYVAWGTAADANHIQILAGQNLTLDGPMADEAVHMIAASGTPAVCWLVQA